MPKPFGIQTWPAISLASICAGSVSAPRLVETRTMSPSRTPSAAGVGGREVERAVRALALPPGGIALDGVGGPARAEPGGHHEREARVDASGRVAIARADLRRASAPGPSGSCRRRSRRGPRGWSRDRWRAISTPSGCASDAAEELGAELEGRLALPLGPERRGRRPRCGTARSGWRSARSAARAGAGSCGPSVR